MTNETLPAKRLENALGKLQEAQSALKLAAEELAIVDAEMIGSDARLTDAGFTAGQIAQTLGVSVSSVYQHRRKQQKCNNFCTHKYMYQLDDRSADILVRYTHQIIEGVDVVTITGIEADPEAIAVIKDDMASKDNDHLIKDLADDLVFSATFRWTERIELRVDPAFAQVATQVFEWECR